MKRSHEIEFEAPNRGRVHRYFCCAQICDWEEPTLWWSHEFKKFGPYDQMGLMGGSNSSPTIRTYKAFIRFLRKHPELNGRDVRLVNRYFGFDINAKAI